MFDLVNNCFLYVLYNLRLEPKIIYFLYFILRYEITEDPEKWLSINRDTGEISSRKNFYIRSPYVKKNKYRAVVKVTDLGEYKFNTTAFRFN